MIRRVLLVLVAASLLSSVVQAKGDQATQVKEKPAKIERDARAQAKSDQLVELREEPAKIERNTRINDETKPSVERSDKVIGEPAAPKSGARLETPNARSDGEIAPRREATEARAEPRGQERHQQRPLQASADAGPEPQPAQGGPNGTDAGATPPDANSNETVAGEETPTPVATQRGGSGPAAPSAASTQPDPIESQRRWIGGLLNATQDPRGRQAETQSVAPPLFGAQWMLLIFGIGMGASMSAIGVRNMARRNTPSKPALAPTPERRNGLDALVQRVARAPMDSVACFQLAIELLKLGVEQDGLRLLDRSIRIDPLLIVRLLQDPRYAPLCHSQGVKRLLADVKRNYDRRLLTAYA